MRTHIFGHEEITRYGSIAMVALCGQWVESWACHTEPVPGYESVYCKKCIKMYQKNKVLENKTCHV